MKVLTTIDLLALPNLETPPTGHVGFGAKSDGLYQKVGTVETKLSIDGHTHTIAQITGLQGALDLKATPADITNAISAIEIGGRNYIFKPSLWQTLGGFSVNEYTIIDSDGNYYSNTRSNTFNLYAGQSYTLSFDVLQVEGSFDAQVIISPSTTIFRKYGIILGRNVYTFTPSQNYVGAELRFFGVNQTTSLLLEVINIKLEKGNKATDWTPAPEDVDAKISLVQTNLNTHTLNTSNPHSVTKAQVGLGSVDNTADSAKNVLSATKLTTARTIWGQSFDGSANVTGALTGATTIAASTSVTAPTFIGALSGNASTATKLATARAINGVNFDGTAAITITANTPATLTRGSYLIGSDFNGSTATTWAVDATSANTASKVVARDASGNFSAGTITAALNGNAATATKLQTARNIAGVSFDGTTNIDIPFVNITGKPTTLSGYGIADAYTKTEINNSLSNKLDKLLFDDLFEKVEVSSGIFAIKAKYDFYSVGEVSAYGEGIPTISFLTGISTTGTGNAITSIEKVGSELLATKGLTFALDSKFQFVTALPTSPDPNTYYFIKE